MEHCLPVKCGSMKMRNEFITCAWEFLNSIDKCEKSKSEFSETLQSILRHVCIVKLDVDHWEKIKSVSMTPADVFASWFSSVVKEPTRFMMDKCLVQKKSNNVSI